MTVRKLLAALVAALLVPTVASAPARAAVASVTVADMAFGPATLKVALGTTVTWRFQDPVPHTTTSDQGFWDSGTKSGGATYDRKFTSAGTFAYHCNIHSMMHGKVRVPVRVTGTTLTWATVKGAGGITYDVQTRLGSGAWTPLRTRVTATHATFDPGTTGVYQVRARTNSGAVHSGWSPVVTVSIS